MASRTFQIVAIVAAVAFMGTVGLTVMAMEDGSEGQEQGGGFLSHLHKLGQRLHGDGHHQNPMAQMIEQLELTPDQLQRLEKVHEIIGSYGSGGHGSMADLHNQLVTQFERGYIESGEIRGFIDEHVEQIRGMAYAVTDELIELINGLDEKQRGILLAHLQGAKSGDHGHGH